jgi:N-acetylmuramoyl-L-alanine amidase
MNSLHFSNFKIRTKQLLFFVFFLALVFTSEQANAQKSEFIVVLDAGHGGRDPGKVGHNGIKEKTIALNIAMKVGKMLAKHENIKVIYTRKTDVLVGLWERGRIANRANADLFVSIHCNAHHTQAYGSETFVLGTHVNRQNFEVAKAENSVILLEENYETNYKGFDPNSPESVIGLTLMQEEYLDQSIQFASIIQDGFTNKLKRKNRGVKQAGFVVLHQTYMPSVLIETGFLTNKNEGPYLNSTKGQDQFSKSIYEGIIKYVEQLKINTVASSAVNDQNTSNSTNTESNTQGIRFKVQIAAGARKLETKAYNFKGLRNVERLQVGNIYKYYIGNSFDLNEVKELQKLAKSKGYPSAFIVGFKNGEKIDIENILEKS